MVALTINGERRDVDVPADMPLLFAAMVGGLALSRAIRDIDDSGSADILRSVKKQLGNMVNC